MANSNSEIGNQIFGKEEENQLRSGEKFSKSYKVQRREVTRFVNRPNDIYIGEKSNFQGAVSKCKKLLDGKFNEVFVHGLGVAIPRAINIVLEIKKFYQGTVDFTSNTSTFKVVDDLIPQDDSTSPSYQNRNVSSIDIHIFRIVKIP